MALVFLLILTILGVFGMNMSRMENLMAGNNQFQTTALNNAELTISIAEQVVDDITLATLPFTDLDNSGDEFYDHSRSGLTYIEPHQLNWSFDYATTDQVPGCESPNEDNCRYVVEYYGKTIRSGGNLEWQTGSSCASSDCAWVFVITAQNQASRGAKRTVQSVFITETAPF
jgi:Tfp pilus assembly protein PilX